MYVVGYTGRFSVLCDITLHLKYLITATSFTHGDMANYI